MDYVRVDWDNGYIEYLKNDTLCADGTYRNAFLLHNHMRYKRIKRISELPPNKKCTVYKRHNKEIEDWEKIQFQKGY